MSEWPFSCALTAEQEAQLETYAVELGRVNRQFNLVSRKDERMLRDHHVGHCLALAHRAIAPGTRVVDWGTGGGLPAVVLAILFPEVQILGVDSNQKKTRSVDLFVRRLGLKNAGSWHGRAEQFDGPTNNLSVSRATAPLALLWSWHERVAATPRSDLDQQYWQDGLLCLKGGDLEAEIAELKASRPHLILERIPLSPLTADPFFATKEIIHVAQGS